MQNSKSILIPKGNTQRGVYSSVFSYLNRHEINPNHLLDVPAGEGEFLETFLKFYPNSQIVGVEPYGVCKSQIASKIEKSTAHKSLALQKSEAYDLVTCLSGVMCFDGIDDLISKISQSLKPGGYLIISNDNILTIRDRLSFMFFGHVKRFKLFFEVREGNWNVILPQGLWSLCRRHNLQVEDIVYCSITPDDLLWLALVPLFLPFYLIAMFTRGKHMSFAEKRRLFPIRSLIARHYYFVCRKN